MFFNFIFIVSLATTSVLALSAPTITSRGDPSKLNPPVSALRHTRSPPIPQFEARLWTNARRLAAGLPLNPPRHIVEKRTGKERPAPSSTPGCNVDGYLMITNEDSTRVGFVSKKWNDFGEYGTIAEGDDRLKVSINTCSDSNSDIKTINGPYADFPFFGGIGGPSDSPDLSGGSDSYAYFGGASQTQPGAPPADAPNAFTKATGTNKVVESAIFTLDRGSKVITAHWVNRDSSRPTTYIGLIENTLILTGDKGAFAQSFAGTRWVGLTFVAA
ncbi:hypothetical protein BD779DRAFT_561406 [Infundibulicybe gibba]|nr:hypothetical protein BD779DRAFT_561406 [Infundibulicybe gibba]